MKTKVIKKMKRKQLLIAVLLLVAGTAMASRMGNGDLNLMV